MTRDKQDDDPLARTRRLEPGDPELGTPVDVKGREAYSIYEAALLYAGRDVVRDGFFGNDLEGARARLNLDARSRDMCEELLNAIDVREICASPGYEHGPPDILNSTITRDELVRWFADLGERPSFLFIDRDTNAATMETSAAAPAALDWPAESTEAKRETLRSSSPVSTFRSTKATRRDRLSPAIEQAQANCVHPLDWLAVWNALEALAKQRFHPLMGVTEEGIQYDEPTKPEGVDYLTRPALRMRISRELQRTRTHASER